MPPDAAETLAAPPAVIDEANLFRSVVRLAGHIFWFSQAGMVAVAVGSTAIIARNVGAGQAGLASRTLRNAFLMALMWGLAIGIAIWFFGEWGLGMLGAEEGAKHQGTVYLKVAAVGMPLWSLVYAGSASLQGAGDTRTPMAIGVVVNFVNIVVAYLLINGPGPFPRLDVLGSGAGFTSAAIIGAALVLLVLASGTRVIHWRPWEALQFDRMEARRVLNVGLPAGAGQIQFNVAFMIYTRIIASPGAAG